MPDGRPSGPVAGAAVRELLEEARRQLVAPERDARLEAELLLAHALGSNRTWLHAHTDTIPEEPARRRFETLVAERAGSSVPIAYLTGHREFYGLDLGMQRGVFIPRPETEGLVDRVVAWLQSGAVNIQSGVVAEPCCGSGAVSIALARVCGIRCLATDVSPAAVALSRRNARALGVEDRVEFHEGNLLAPLEAMRPRPRIVAVVCNPPYVTTGEMASLPGEVAAHEPHLALVAGEDGLEVIRRLADEAALWLVPGGLLAMEIGAGQGPVGRSLLEGEGWVGARVERDLAGRDRYLVATAR